MKINYGCGKEKLKEYLNVDITKEVNPDKVVPPLPKLQPFKNKEFSVVYCKSVTPYIKTSEIIPSLKEQCRIGQKVIINFTPLIYRSTVIFEKDISSMGYSITDLRNLDKRRKKKNDWINRDYNLKINKIWFNLNFDKYFPINLIKKLINKSERMQTYYEKSFMFMFPPNSIWMEIEEYNQNNSS